MRGLFAAIAGAALGLLPALVHAEELKVGNVYRTSVKILDTMGDVYLPLPEGDWQLIGLGMSSTREGHVPLLTGRLVTMAVDKNRRPLAFITFTVATQGSSAGWAPPPVCARKDLNFVYPEDPRQNVSGGRIDCWAVYPTTMRPPENAPSWMLDAYKWTGTHTAGMPLTTIVAQYIHASGFKILDASYMFNPEAQGFKALSFNSWDRARIVSEKHLVTYVERVHQFAVTWKPRMERGFSGEAVTDPSLPDSANPLRHAALAATTGMNQPPDIKNINAVPYIGGPGKKAYSTFLSKPAPRAFAISQSGAWGWADKTPAEETIARALQHCSEKSDQPCKLYAVDDKIVWDGK